MPAAALGAPARAVPRFGREGTALPWQILWRAAGLAMAFAKPATSLTTADSVGFGPYPGLSPKHGGQINMNAIFQSRNQQEKRFYSDLASRKPKGPPHLGVLRGFEVQQNSTYTDVRRLSVPVPPWRTRELQHSGAWAPVEERAPAVETAATPSGCSPMASTWPPKGGAGSGAEAWVPGLPRRRKAPKGPLELPAAGASPVQRSEPPKYAFTRNTMSHMTEQHLHGTKADTAAVHSWAGRAHVSRESAMPKYALTQNSMWHMKDLEESGDLTKSGRHLRKVLAKSGSAPALAASFPLAR